MTHKTLVAIVTARHREDWREVIRDTWLPYFPKSKADIFFFMGNGSPSRFLEDEVALDCDDTYYRLPEKIKAIAKWSLDHDYEYMLKCDDDVVLAPIDLLNSGYQQYEYTGRANRPPQPYIVPYGFNYWLSKKSMGVVAEAPLPPDGSNDDEKWVAKHLWDKDIVLHDDRRYYLHEFRLLDEIKKRSLRAPRRQKLYVQEFPYFSWCIHISDAQDIKLQEFRKIFDKNSRTIKQYEVTPIPDQLSQ